MLSQGQGIEAVEVIISPAIMVVDTAAADISEGGIADIAENGISGDTSDIPVVIPADISGLTVVMASDIMKTTDAVTSGITAITGIEVIRTTVLDSASIIRLAITCRRITTMTTHIPIMTPHMGITAIITDIDAADLKSSIIWYDLREPVPEELYGLKS